MNAAKMRFFRMDNHAHLARRKKVGLGPACKLHSTSVACMRQVPGMKLGAAKASSQLSRG